MDQNRKRPAAEAATDEALPTNVEGPASHCNHDPAGASPLPVAEPAAQRDDPPTDSRFATKRAEEIYWAGVSHGRAAARVAGDPAAAAPAPASATANGGPRWERGEGAVNTPDEPGFNVPLLSDTLAALHSESLADRIPDTVEASFPPGGRKPRHDGWTPEKIGGFLRHLAASGVVEHAADSVGLSASSAYAFRNRRQGRAFARMWDAILIHRSRARLASETQARAVAGCVSLRKKDGIVVSEYHYYDNRLAMSLLTRLDRLADKEADSEAHLRTLSEDLEDYIDCVEQGGDVDAFVEARRPEPPRPEPPAPDPLPPSTQKDEVPDPDPELTTFAYLSGCRDYLDADPREIEVLDLDPTAKADWSPDHWVRAYRGAFMTWLAVCAKADPGFAPGPGEPVRFFFLRAAAAAATDPELAAPELEEDAAAAAALPDPATIDDWTEEQLACGWRSGLLMGLPAEFWEDLAERAAGGGGED